MKISRYFSSRIIGRVCTALLSLTTISANAQETEQRPSGQIINFTANDGLRAEDAAQILAKRLQMNASTDELRSAYIERPGDGIQVQRFNQYYKGIRVEHGTFTLTSKNGTPTYAFGRFLSTAAVTGTTPAIDEATALSKAIAFVKAEKYAWENGSEEYPVGKIIFCEDFSGGEPDGIIRLAYAFDIYAVAPERRDMVYVDAATGKILLSDALLKHAHVTATGASLYSDTVSFMAEQIGSLYYLHDSTRGNGIYTYSSNNTTSTTSNVPVSSPMQVTSTTPLFSKDAAVDAHWGATVVYDYWKGTHNRDSWDGNGGALRSYVHFSSNYENASWNSNRMQYGDGRAGGFPPLTAMDVCAHEIGHGICQSTANLVYQRESGAMNEGFSDIWGAVIEAFSDPHEVDAFAKDPWLIGEELLGPSAMRSMRNPNLYNQPDTYLGLYWIDASTRCTPNSNTNDNCGVHYNSGILNHWFYLLTEGGKSVNDLNNAYKVSGIGMAKAARVAYLTELALNSTANYAACRNASIAAATTLYGACSPEVEAVTSAWYAVGVGTNFVPCVPEVSFSAPIGSILEDASDNSCRPNHMVSVPVNLNGAALAGDSAVVTMVVFGGTAVAGVDYDLITPALVFKVGGATTLPVLFKVYDNGLANASKYIALTYKLTVGGSNATTSLIQDTARIFIANDDFEPHAGQDELRKVLNFNSTSTANSPFLSSATGARYQYIYLADELLAAGVRPGVPLTAAELNVMTKNSTAAFNNYTLKLANTSRKDMNLGNVTAGFVTVFSSSVNTVLGANELAFTTPFVWDGIANLAVEICFSNTNVTTGNDGVQVQTGRFFVGTMASSTGIGADGCAMANTASSPINSRPVIWFKQPTQVETAVNGTRTWDMDASQQLYFYSHNTKKLIAAVLQPSDSLGCITTTVTAAGNGSRISANGLQRSVKEFSITPVSQVGAISYDGIFYFSNEELAGISPGRVKIVQTTSADDNSITTSNTNIITPSLIQGLNYIGFRATFTGFGRFFLEVGNALSVGGGAVKSSELWTGENPFHTAPVLHWNLATQEHVNVRLYDITGKLVYGNEQTLAAGNHQVLLPVNAGLASGTYVLQVVRPSGVFTRQLVKQ